MARPRKSDQPLQPRARSAFSGVWGRSPPEMQGVWGAQYPRRQGGAGGPHPPAPLSRSVAGRDGVRSPPLPSPGGMPNRKSPSRVTIQTSLVVATLARACFGMHPNPILSGLPLGPLAPPQSDQIGSCFALFYNFLQLSLTRRRGGCDPPPPPCIPGRYAAQALQKGAPCWFAPGIGLGS